MKDKKLSTYIIWVVILLTIALLGSRIMYGQFLHWWEDRAIFFKVNQYIDFILLLEDGCFILMVIYGFRTLFGVHKQNTFAVLTGIVIAITMLVIIMYLSTLFASLSLFEGHQFAIDTTNL
jgi:hypothetical protein